MGNLSPEHEPRPDYKKTSLPPKDILRRGKDCHSRWISSQRKDGTKKWFFPEAANRTDPWNAAE